MHYAIRSGFLFGAFAALCCLLLAWFFPLSNDLIVRAVLIGTFAGFTVQRLVWQEADRLDLTTLVLIIIVLVPGGFFWSRDHAFGSQYPKDSLPLLAAQYLTGILASGSLMFGLLRLNARTNQD